MAFVSEEMLPGAPSPEEAKTGRRGASGGRERQRPDLTWEEIGFLGRALAVAPKQWRAGALMVRERYSLGPRGPWIIGLIASEDSCTPSDLTAVFQCGRSLITAELNRLADAGLIATRKSDEDGRQVRLSLTAEGQQVRQEVGEALVTLINERLAGYSREDVLFCARLLSDFARSAN
jgi:DNA-binding MarR family transcriptional regulator